MTSKNKLIILSAGSAVLGILAVTGTAFAAPGSPGHASRPVAIGVVSAINADTLTVVSKAPPAPPNSVGVPTTSTTYTVDATNASIVNGRKTSTFSTISVGDRTAIWGTLNGSNITATKIRIDMPPHKIPLHKIMSPHQLALKFHGNGDPVVGGSVVTINGTTLTIANAEKITYTVNASSATVEKVGGMTTVLTNIVIGDSVIVQGVFTGTTVVASSILDQGPSITHPITTVQGPPKPPSHFFGPIGFFTHIFGF